MAKKTEEFAKEKDVFREHIQKAGLRRTAQRDLILEVFLRTEEHLTSEDLYWLVQKEDPTVGHTTVYRTLKLLKQGGLVDELDLMHQAGEQHYYETRRKQEHAHVICLGCGKVEEFFGEPLQRLRKQIETHFGFKVVLARTEVGGYCSHCQTLRAQELERAAAPRPPRLPEKARRTA